MFYPVAVKTDALCMSFKKVNNRGLKQSQVKDTNTMYSCVCHSKK